MNKTYICMKRFLILCYEYPVKLFFEKILTFFRLTSYIIYDTIFLPRRYHITRGERIHLQREKLGLTLFMKKRK